MPVFPGMRAGPIRNGPFLGLAKSTPLITGIMIWSP